MKPRLLTTIFFCLALGLLDSNATSQRSGGDSRARTTQRSTPRPVQRTTPRPVQRATPRPVQRATPRQVQRSTPRQVQRSSPRQVQRSSPRPTTRYSPPSTSSRSTSRSSRSYDATRSRTNSSRSSARQPTRVTVPRSTVGQSSRSDASSSKSRSSIVRRPGSSSSTRTTTRSTTRYQTDRTAPRSVGGTTRTNPSRQPGVTPGTLDRTSTIRRSKGSRGLDTQVRPSYDSLRKPTTPRRNPARPTTTRTLVDRYQPSRATRTNSTTKRPTKGPIKGDVSSPRDSAIRSTTTRPGASKPTRPSARPTTRPGAMASRPADSTRPTKKPASRTIDRYIPSSTTSRPKPGATRTPTTPTTVTPTQLGPRASATPPSAMPLANPPRLVPRSQASAVAGNYGYGYGYGTGLGSCATPYWDPCYSWSSYCDPYWQVGLNWSVGCTFGSFFWGWTSYYPWYCYRSYRYYYNPASYWWNSYYDPFAPSVYYPSTVYVYADSPEPAPLIEDPVAPGEAAPSPVVARGPLSPLEEAIQYVDLGDFYFREGRYSEAAKAYANARKLAPEDATIHFVLADAVFAGGDYHFAAFLIIEALRLDPELAYAETDKRLLYGDFADFERQMKTLEAYTADKPYDAMAHLVLGYNLKFSGKPMQALAQFQRVLEIDPTSEAAQLFVNALKSPRPKAPAKEVKESPDKAKAAADKSGK